MNERVKVDFVYPAWKIPPEENVLVEVLSLLLNAIELFELLIYLRQSWLTPGLVPLGLIRLMEGMVEGLMTKLFASLDKREMEGFCGSEKQKPLVTVCSFLLYPQVSQPLRTIQKVPRELLPHVTHHCVISSAVL